MNVVKMAVTGLTGFQSFLMQSTEKYAAANPNYTFDQRIGDAVANVLGNGVARKIFPNWTGAADMTINPMGWANKYTGSGLALLFGAGMARKARIPYISKILPILTAAGTGLTIGGTTGGIFDPANGGQTQQPTYQRSTRTYSGNPFK